MIAQRHETNDRRLPSPVDEQRCASCSLLTEKLLRLEARVQELEQANEELTKSHLAQTQFLSSMSHELRTPLTSIQSYCELLQMFGDEDAETREEFLQNIEHESKRLTSIVDTVLDGAKVEDGKMEWAIRENDLREALLEAAEDMWPMVSEKGLALDTQLPEALPVLKFDRKRIIQAATNILNNAVKFTSSGTVTLGAEFDGTEALVWVQDTGIGIAPEHHRTIFDRFRQIGDLLTGKPTGTGMGLTLCRGIVQHHGGRIWVESSPGEGSTFFFTLPKTAEAGQ